MGPLAHFGSKLQQQTRHFPKVTLLTVNLPMKSQSVDFVWGMLTSLQAEKRSREFTTVSPNLASESLWLSPDLLVVIDCFKLLDLPPLR